MLVTGPFLTYLNQDTLKKKYNVLRKIEWAYKYDIYNSSAIISPFPKQICITNKELRIWLNWVNRNIVGLLTSIVNRARSGFEALHLHILIL